MEELVIAVDLGGTNVRVALVSMDGKIRKGPIREATNKSGGSGMAVTDQIIRLVHDCIQGGDLSDIAGIGIASIGPLDHDKGGPVESPNVPYDLIPLVGPIGEVFNLPVSLHNDASAGAMGEWYFGHGQDKRNLVYVTISTGIGGGAVIDGYPILGKGGNAVEVGHIVVDTFYNLLCTCDKGNGHWESLASGANIPRFFHHWQEMAGIEAGFEVREAKDVFDQGRKGNKTALEFLDELSRINARAISSITAAYAPELITLGGSVALMNPDIILPGIKKYMDHYMPEDPEILVTGLGDRVSLMGAAAAMFDTRGSAGR